MPVANIQIPEKGFMRLKQILGDKKTNTPAIIPVGRTTFLNNVKSGLYPQPVKLGVRTVAWKVEDIRALIEQMGAA
jgi:hypothetical protein